MPPRALLTTCTLLASCTLALACAGAGVRGGSAAVRVAASGELPTWLGERPPVTGLAQGGSAGESNADAAPEAVRAGACFLPRRSSDSRVGAPTLALVGGNQLVACWTAGQGAGAPHRELRCASWTRQEAQEEQPQAPCGWREAEVVSAAHGVPVWSPVVGEPIMGACGDAEGGGLALYYSLGRAAGTARHFVRCSVDGGASWSAQRMLAAPARGPARAPPLRLDDGTTLLVAAHEREREGGWRWLVFKSADEGRTFDRGVAVARDGGLLEPVLLRPRAEDDSPSPRTPLLIGASGSAQRVAVAEALDAVGGAWGEATLAEALPAPAAPLAAVALQAHGPGALLVVYSHSLQQGAAGRGLLVAAVSADAGKTWRRLDTLEDARGRPYEFGAPAAAEDPDSGAVHIVYTWRGGRELRHQTIESGAIARRLRELRQAEAL